jgi:stress-induced morphogen
MTKTAKKVQDTTTASLYAALKKAFPGLSKNPEDVVYRYNPVAVRVRVISEKFEGKGSAQREAMVNKALRGLPDEVTEDITMLFTLTPEEAKKPTLLQLEFDDPTDSYL